MFNIAFHLPLKSSAASEGVRLLFLDGIGTL
jgi:hypothetical protein